MRTLCLALAICMATGCAAYAKAGQTIDEVYAIEGKPNFEKMWPDRMCSTWQLPDAQSGFLINWLEVCSVRKDGKWVVEKVKYRMDNLSRIQPLP